MFPFFAKCKMSMILTMGPNECPVLCRCFANVVFGFWYLQDWRCSLYLLRNDMPVRPVYLPAI